MCWLTSLLPLTNQFKMPIFFQEQKERQAKKEF